MTHEEVMDKARKGNHLAEVLQLRPIGGLRGTRYGAMFRTAWGKKTAFGLCETVQAILSGKDGQE